MDRGGNPAPAHPLARVRQARGWSYQDVARLVAEHALALGVPMAARREKVWRWEHWGVIPERDSQRALARALGVPFADLDTRPWPAWLTADPAPAAGLPWDQSGSIAALTALLEGTGDEDHGHPAPGGPELDRALTEWAAAPAAASAAADDPPSGAARVGRPSDAADDGDAGADEADDADDAVGWLERGVPVLRRLDDRFGGEVVRRRVEADLALTTDLLRRGAQGPHTRRRLYRVAADLTQLGGWACADAGRHTAAQRHHLTGLRLAHTALDPLLTVGILAGLSLHAVLAGHPADALAAADAAARATPGGGPRRVRALLAVRRARAHALLREEAACRRSLADAEQLLDAAADEETPSWLYYFDGAELAAQSGTALLDLGMPDHARTLLDRALADQDPSCVRDRALYAIRAATAHLLVGDTDRARALTQEAERLAPHCTSPRVTTALADLRHRLSVLPTTARPPASAPLDTDRRRPQPFR
ncbi:helix-turn-helix transcriptional regulator [Peterkaempfera bronchialis]|uniref:helix-turn-helix transcriptional regulator n=1 Tax=Peterkaempfera bronchialis TaxID=2126346 RepID=UPI00158EB00A|nr:helix-turn-helix transcriptional regulator [Peterkaempfera bronchialis]